MAGPQPLAGQEAGEQHDQQRPEIGDQARLRRRREPQRGEVAEMIAEEPADADQPDHRPHAGEGGPQPPRDADPAEAEEPADARSRAPRAGTAAPRPTATVSSASVAQSSTAPKPMAVARARLTPRRGPLPRAAGSRRSAAPRRGCPPGGPAWRGPPRPASTGNTVPARSAISSSMNSGPNSGCGCNVTAAGRLGIAIGDGGDGASGRARQHRRARGQRHHLVLVQRPDREAVGHVRHPAGPRDHLVVLHAEAPALVGLHRPAPQRLGEHLVAEADARPPATRAATQSRRNALSGSIQGSPS